jgi:hypothetical protein
MKKIKYFVLLIIFIVISNSVFCDNQVGQSDSVNFIQFLLPKDISVGYKAINLDYQESVPEKPEFKSQERGYIPGFFISTTTNREYPLYFYLNLEYVKGDEVYDGGIQEKDTIIPFKGITNSSFFQFDLGARYRIEVTDEFNIIPYSGFSFRSWDRNIEQDNPAGIEEIYSWMYFPLGLKIDYALTDRFTVLLDLYSNLMVYGTIDILYSKRNPNQPDINLNLGNISSYGVGISLNYYVNKNISLFFNPYIENYGFGKSNIYTHTDQQTITTIYEPSSKTKVYVMKLGLTFRF